MCHYAIILCDQNQGDIQKNATKRLWQAQDVLGISTSVFACESLLYSFAISVRKQNQYNSITVFCNDKNARKAWKAYYETFCIRNPNANEQNSLNSETLMLPEFKYKRTPVIREFCSITGVFQSGDEKISKS